MNFFQRKMVREDTLLIDMISVVIPIYNKALYIEKAINSVLSQSYKDYELIIVNDGSTDGSLDVVEKIIENISTRIDIKVVNQENSGVSAARNRGVELAKGEYIAFLDADDWWDEDYLQKMYQLIVDYPNATLYGSSYKIVKHKKSKVPNIGLPTDFQSGIINYFAAYAKTLVMPLSTSATIIKKSIFEELGGFNTNISLGEDFELWVRVALMYDVAYINKPLSYYNQDVKKKK